jgi:hypothetical protein
MRVVWSAEVSLLVVTFYTTCVRQEFASEMHLDLFHCTELFGGEQPSASSRFHQRVDCGRVSLQPFF